MARPTKQPHEKRTERFNLRFTVAELAFVQDQAEAAGIEPTEYLRLRALGYQVPRAPRRADVSLITELNRIGVNLNQIARSLNTGRQLRIDADLALAELRGLLEKVTAAHGA